MESSMNIKSMPTLLIFGLALNACTGATTKEPDPKTVNEIRDLQARAEKENDAMRPIAVVHLIERAIGLMEPFVGAESGRMADGWLLLAEAYRQMDDYDESLAAIQKAQDILRQPGYERSPIRAKAMIEHARLLSAMGSHDEAIDKARQSVEILELSTGRKSPAVIKGLYVEAILLKDAGQHDRAVQSLTAALRMIQEDEGANSFEFTRTLHTLAEIHADAKQFERAESLHQQALTIRQRTLRDNVLTARSFQRLARFQHERGDAPQALESLRQAVTMLEPAGPSKEFASILADQGAVESALDRDAEPTLAKSIKMYEDTLGQGASPIADVLIERAKHAQKHAQKHGRNQQADQFLEQAIKITEQAFGPKSPRVAWVLLEKARIQIARGDQPNARKSVDQATQLVNGASLSPKREKELREMQRQINARTN